MSDFGVIVTTRTALPARGRASRTDTLFLATQTASGSTTAPTLCQSLLDFGVAYGDRTGLTVDAYDYLDTFFHEGGKRAYVGRYDASGDGSYADALELFQPKHGPGQLAIIGTDPSESVYADMKTHCDYSDGPSMNNRFALRDVASASSVADMETLADTAPTNDESGATFGRWVTVPAPAGVYGSGPRTVPASAAVAGLIARADVLGNPNRAPAGMDYPLRFATGFAGPDISDVDRAGLFTHGVNDWADYDDVLQLYGFQTNVPESPDNPFWQANCSRARMYLKDRAQVRGRAYNFRNIDGRGHLAGQFKGDLAQEFKALYDLDGLFGNSPSEAYYIEVGEVVNTISETALGHLHAVAAARFSLHTKAVYVDLVSVPITGSVA